MPVTADSDGMAATEGQLAGAPYAASNLPARRRDRLAWSGHVAGRAVRLFVWERRHATGSHGGAVAGRQG